MAEAQIVQRIYPTLPDAGRAEEVARLLVAERLVACVNILAPVTSVYRWGDAVEQAVEVPILAKTSIGQLRRAIERLRGLHPYDLPVIEHWQAGTDQAAAGWIAGATAPEGVTR